MGQNGQRLGNSWANWALCTMSGGQKTNLGGQMNYHKNILSLLPKKPLMHKTNLLKSGALEVMLYF